MAAPGTSTIAIREELKPELDNFREVTAERLGIRRLTISDAIRIAIRETLAKYASQDSESSVGAR